MFLIKYDLVVCLRCRRSHFSVGRYCIFCFHFHFYNSSHRYLRYIFLPGCITPHGIFLKFWCAMRLMLALFYIMVVPYDIAVSVFIPLGQTIIDRCFFLNVEGPIRFSLGKRSLHDPCICCLKKSRVRPFFETFVN